MEGKKTISIYTDYLGMVEELTSDERGRVFTWILEYCNDLNPELPDDRILRIVCKEIQTDLKRDLEKWKAKCSKNAENGHFGGRPKKRTVIEKTERLFSKPKKADKDKDKDKDKDIYIPTWQDFQKYALTQKPNIDQTDLRLKYQSWVENGWRTSGEKGREIKNWKSTLLNTIPHLKESQTQEGKKVWI